MKDRLHYRLIDEPQPSVLQRIALPPLLVFMAATYFLPWGMLLIALNAVALNGPQRNREIGFSVLPILVYFLALKALDIVVRTGILQVNQADYFFVTAVGVGLVFAAMAYVSQNQTSELRRYLRQQG